RFSMVAASAAGSVSSRVWSSAMRPILASVLEAEHLVDEDDGDAAGHDLGVDDQDLVNGAVDAVRRHGSSVLERKGVLVDPPQPLLEVRDDLLRPNHQDHPAGTADVGSA